MRLYDLSHQQKEISDGKKEMKVVKGFQRYDFGI